MSTYNHINDQDDSDTIHPQFSKGSLNNPFKAGDDYFENFASKIQHRVSEFEELNMEAPLLSNIPKYNPFALPAGYFDELPTLVQQRVNADKQRTPSLIEWLQLVIKPRFVFPVLTVVFLAFAGLNYMNRSTIAQKPGFAEEVSMDDQLQMQNIDESAIVDALATQGTTTQATPVQDNENDHIVDYLMDNNVDETNLTSAL